MRFDYIRTFLDRRHITLLTVFLLLLFWFWFNRDESKIEVVPLLDTSLPEQWMSDWRMQDFSTQGEFLLKVAALSAQTTTDSQYITLEKPKFNNKELTISADSGQWESSSRHLRLKQNINLSLSTKNTDNFHLRAEYLDLEYRDERNYRFIARGNPTEFEHNKKSSAVVKGEADIFHYDNENAFMLLSGSARIDDAEILLTGDELRYFFNETP